MGYIDFTVTNGEIVSAANQNQNMLNIRDVVNGTNSTTVPTTSLVGLSLSIVPTGAIMAWPTDTPPTGWLELDNSLLDRTTFAALFAVIGVTYGNTTGSNFQLPDYRGVFPRGWDHGRNQDTDKAARTNRGDGTTGDNIGTQQTSAFQLHQHGGSRGPDFGAGPNGGFETPGVDDAQMTVGYHVDGGGTPRTSDETRPVNIYTMWIIKT